MYFVLIAFFIILIYVYDLKAYSHFRNLFYNIILISFILLAGLRYHIGIDSLRYEQWFNNDLPTINHFSFNSYYGYEPLFVLLSSLIKTLFGGWIFAQIIFAFIINVIIFRYIKKYTRYIFTAVLIYFISWFFDYNCETIRQSLAVAVFLMSIRFLEHKKYVKYYIFAIIAFLFHYSSIVVFIIPLILKFRINWVSCVFFVVLLAIGAYVRIKFGAILNLLGTLYEPILHYSVYENNALVTDSLNYKGMIFVIGCNVLPYIFAVNILRRHNISNNVLEAILLLYLSFVILACNIPLFHRFTQYFGIISVIYFADIMGSSFNTSIRYNFKSKIVATYVCMAFLLSTYMQNISVDENTGLSSYRRYYPYSSIITKTTYSDREYFFSSTL